MLPLWKKKKLPQMFLEDISLLRRSMNMRRLVSQIFLIFDKYYKYFNISEYYDDQAGYGGALSSYNRRF